MKATNISKIYDMFIVLCSITVVLDKVFDTFSGNFSKTFCKVKLHWTVIMVAIMVIIMVTGGSAEMSMQLLCWGLQHYFCFVLKCF